MEEATRYATEDELKLLEKPKTNAEIKRIPPAIDNVFSTFVREEDKVYELVKTLSEQLKTQIEKNEEISRLMAVVHDAMIEKELADKEKRQALREKETAQNALRTERENNTATLRKIDQIALENANLRQESEQLKNRLQPNASGLDKVDELNSVIKSIRSANEILKRENRAFKIFIKQCIQVSIKTTGMQIDKKEVDACLVSLSQLTKE